MARVTVGRDCYRDDPKQPWFYISGQAFHHATKVLRVGRRDRLRIVDGSGLEYECEVEALGPDSLQAIVLSSGPLAVEPCLKVHLFCALLKGEKMDFVLQKATELGVRSISFFRSERAVVKLPENTSKLERWSRIVAAAAAQSGRAEVPSVAGPLGLDAALVDAARSDLAILLWEGERSVSLAELLRQRPPRGSAAIVVGPEGGFSAAEVKRALHLDMDVASMGDRILRAETAAIVAPALLLYELGDLG